MSKAVIHKDAKEIVEKAAQDAAKSGGWFTVNADGATATVDCGPMGKVIVGLVDGNLELFALAAAPKAPGANPDPELVAQFWEEGLRQAVQQWDKDTFGPLPSEWPDEERRKRTLAVKALYRDRIINGAMQLSKN